MARMTVKGLEEFTTALHNLGDKMEGVMKEATYAGADKLIESVKTQISSLPTQDGYMPEGQKRGVITEDEKRDLLSHVGISRMESTGGKVTVAVGFNGYSSHRTKKYPNGVPIPLIARSIESGSSVRRKVPFMRTAAKSNAEGIKAAMTGAATAAIEKLTK